MASVTRPCSIQEQTLALRGKLGLGEYGPVSACLGVCPDLPALACYLLFLAVWGQWDSCPCPGRPRRQSKVMETAQDWLLDIAVSDELGAGTLSSIESRGSEPLGK